MRLKLTRRLWIPESGIAILMIIHENQHNLAVITCVGAQATSHQSTASINSIFFLWIRAHLDQSSSLDDRQPVVLPDCLRAFEGGGSIGFLSL